MRAFTRARIALGRAGSSLPTKEVLDFGLCHAMARDAVHTALDAEHLQEQLTQAGFASVQLHSNAAERADYLLRPDWGRRLNEASRDYLQSLRKTPIDLLFVVGDGLSSLAIERNALPLLKALQKVMPAQWRTGEVIIVLQARVAIADEIAELMRAKMVAILIGERPGLSSPDSLGIYFTYNPKVTCNDADRNCISNIRPEGLSYDTAAKKLIWLAQEAMRLQKSGVLLKDESDQQDIAIVQGPAPETAQ